METSFEHFEGRWVFVPLAKWETIPPEFYSIRRSRIFVTLFSRNVPCALIDFCVERELLPPFELRGRKLLAWIVTHQAALEAFERIAAEQLVAPKVAFRTEPGINDALG